MTRKKATGSGGHVISGGTRKATARKVAQVSIAPRKKPRQARSSETVDAILDAAAEMFANHGYARTTTNKIAQRAGVSIGSLYQYFPNKDAVLARLMAVHQRDVHRTLHQSLGELADPDTDLEEGLRNIMVGLLTVHHDRPHIARALRADVLHQSRLDHKHGEEMEFHGRVVEVLAGRPDVRAGDHQVMAAVMGQVAETLTRWLVHEAPDALDPVSLQEQSVQMLYRFLKK